MSLGLPEFGSRGSTSSGRNAWDLLRALGVAALVYTLAVFALEWRASQTEGQSLARSSEEAARVTSAAEQNRRSLQKNADLLILAASIESSPQRVLEDLNRHLPQGVSVPSLKIEYALDGTTKLDVTVVARSPMEYDQFLDALSRSANFAELRPGAETRPGLVRATLTALHRPGGAR